MTEDEKQRIRSLFALVLRLIKTESETSTRLSAELASLTSSVRALDPAFDEVLEHHQKSVEEITRPVTHADAAQFDEMIRKVESGEIL
jgi:esterase/lipase